MFISLHGVTWSIHDHSIIHKQGQAPYILDKVISWSRGKEIASDGKKCLKRKGWNKWKVSRSLPQEERETTTIF